MGRWATLILFLAGCLWAPLVGRMGSVFQYIQMFWGFISPGIVAAFVIGMLSPRTPPLAAKGAMILGIPVYGLLLWFLPGVAFLHHMAITFLVVVAYMGVVTVLRPLPAPVVFPVAPRHRGGIRRRDALAGAPPLPRPGAMILGIPVYGLLLWFLPAGGLRAPHGHHLPPRRPPTWRS